MGRLVVKLFVAFRTMLEAKGVHGATTIAVGMRGTLRLMAESFVDLYGDEVGRRAVEALIKELEAGKPLWMSVEAVEKQATVWQAEYERWLERQAQEEYYAEQIAPLVAAEHRAEMQWIMTGGDCDRW